MVMLLFSHCEHQKSAKKMDVIGVRRGGGGGAEAPPPPPPLPLKFSNSNFGAKKICNIRAKPLDFRANNGENIRATDLSPPKGNNLVPYAYG